MGPAARSEHPPPSRGPPSVWVPSPTRQRICQVPLLTALGFRGRPAPPLTPLPTPSSPGAQALALCSSTPRLSVPSPAPMDASSVSQQPPDQIAHTCSPPITRQPPLCVPRTQRASDERRHFVKVMKLFGLFPYTPTLLVRHSWAVHTTLKSGLQGAQVRPPAPPNPDPQPPGPESWLFYIPKQQTFQTFRIQHL